MDAAPAPPPPLTQVQRDQLFRRLIGRRVGITYSNGLEHKKLIVIPAALRGYPQTDLVAYSIEEKSDRTFPLDTILHAWDEDSRPQPKELQDYLHRLRNPNSSPSVSPKAFFWFSLLALLLSVAVFIGAGTQMTPASVSVSGYTRSDGTRVRSHSRRPPGSKKHDAPWEALRLVGFFGIAVSGICTFVGFHNMRER